MDPSIPSGISTLAVRQSDLKRFLDFITLRRVFSGEVLRSHRPIPLDCRLNKSNRNSIVKPMLSIMLLSIALLAGGCNRFLAKAPTPWPEGHEPIANPLNVPMVDRELLMDQISDELDDYFRIYREERLRLVNNVLTEGWIETHPKIGATLFEPWRKDSTTGFERLHATLQTVRRFAKVRVIPYKGSYAVDVQVYKELEDRVAPERATVSGRNIRINNALDSDNDDPFFSAPNQGWIPMGRDRSLEQQILRNIQERVARVCGVQ